MRTKVSRTLKVLAFQRSRDNSARGVKGVQGDFFFRPPSPPPLSGGIYRWFPALPPLVFRGLPFPGSDRIGVDPEAKMTGLCPPFLRLEDRSAPLGNRSAIGPRVEPAPAWPRGAPTDRRWLSIARGRIAPDRFRPRAAPGRRVCPGTRRCRWRSDRTSAGSQVLQRAR